MRTLTNTEKDFMLVGGCAVGGPASFRHFLERAKNYKFEQVLP
jgi:hypothetical protein